MKKQLSRIIFILIISLFIQPLIGYSQTELTEELINIRREPLKGIKGIYVVIENIKPEAIELGITRELLKTEVEPKLRLAGLIIHSREEYLKDSTTVQQLYVNLNILRIIFGDIIIYPFNIRIALSETVYIERDFTRSTAIRWNEASVGATTKENSLKLIREQLKILLDKFLNDYLAVNPKK